MDGIQNQDDKRHLWSGLVQGEQKREEAGGLGGDQDKKKLGGRGEEEEKTFSLLIVPSPLIISLFFLLLFSPY